MILASTILASTSQLVEDVPFELQLIGKVDEKYCQIPIEKNLRNILLRIIWIFYNEPTWQLMHLFVDGIFLRTQYKHEATPNGREFFFWISNNASLMLKKSTGTGCVLRIQQTISQDDINLENPLMSQPLMVILMTLH